MSYSYVKFILVFCASGCVGFLKGENLNLRYQNHHLQELESFVYQKIEGIERLLATKDERVHQLESEMVNQKSEIVQLRRNVVALEQEIVHKDAIVDRLVNRVRDLETRTMLKSVAQETNLGQFRNVNKDSKTWLNNNLQEQSHSPTNRTTQLQKLVRSSSFGNGTGQGTIYPSKSRHGEFADSEVSQPISDQTANEVRELAGVNSPKMYHKSIIPSTQIPKPVAFHVTLSTDKKYHEDNTVVFDHEKLDHGNGYNPANGIYTAPESGTYVITWTSLCYGNQQFQTVLVVNGVYAGSSWTDAEVVNDVHQTTAVVVTTFNQGDRVYIRMGSTFGHGNILSRTDFGESTFSGWKLD